MLKMPTGSSSVDGRDDTPAPSHPMQTTSAFASETGKEYLSPDQVAKLLQLSRLTIYRLIDRGMLPVYKLCRRLRIRRDDVEHLLDRSREKVGLSPYGHEED